MSVPGCRAMLRPVGGDGRWVGLVRPVALGLESGGEPDAQAASNRLTGVGGPISSLAMDLVVPVAGYYVLRAIGLDAVLALVLAGVPPAAAIGYRAARQRWVDALGVFVVAVLAGSVALSFVTGSPRFLLAKEAWWTAAIGVGFLVSLRFARPATFCIARAALGHSSLATTLRAESWDNRWERDHLFRRRWQVVTVLWGTGLIADAGVRVILAYTLPVDIVPALGAALWAVTFLVLQAAQHIYFTRAHL